MMKGIRTACLAFLSFSPFAFSSPLSTSNYAIRNRFSSNPSLSLAPLHIPSKSQDTINNSYIIIFKDDAPADIISSHLSFLSTLQVANIVDDGMGQSGLNHVWTSSLKGYSGRFNTEIVDMIRAQPEVEFVEHDQVVNVYEKQRAAPWGLARVSHRNKLTLSTFNTYEFDKNGGEGVDVYVIDTGIFINHTEFEGRASWGKTIPLNDQDIDGNGHGTHCAGTIASRKYGVAKKANVIAVKVLGTNGSGSMSDVVAGVVFAADTAAAKRAAAQAELSATGKTSHKGSVANMSLGGGKSPALDLAVNRAVTSGLHFAVAAGNDNQDACNYSPAAAENAVTVGASTLADERASFSNHGSCVDVFAPGQQIKSTWNRHEEDENTISGTSMASPHTAGMLAYLLSIFPSDHFDPEISSSPAEAKMSLDANPTYIPTFSQLYNKIHSFLPSTLSHILPAPSFVSSITSQAPVPTLPEITPLQLKKALIALSTKGAIVGGPLPAGTPNLLIFNNATDAKGKTWAEEKGFWESL